MPIYKFENTETEEVFDEMMSWEDSKVFLEENPHVRRVIGAPMIVSGVRSSSGPKVDDGFREAIARVKENQPINNIKDY